MICESSASVNIFRISHEKKKIGSFTFYVCNAHFLHPKIIFFFLCLYFSPFSDNSHYLRVINNVQNAIGFCKWALCCCRMGNNIKTCNSKAEILGFEYILFARNSRYLFIRLCSKARNSYNTFCHEKCTTEQTFTFDKCRLASKFVVL